MLISTNIRVQLTAEEKGTLRVAAKICDELMDALGMAITNYDVDIEKTKENLLQLVYEDYFEYIDNEG